MRRVQKHATFIMYSSLVHDWWKTKIISFWWVGDDSSLRAAILSQEECCVDVKERDNISLHSTVLKFTEDKEYIRKIDWLVGSYFAWQPNAWLAYRENHPKKNIYKQNLRRQIVNHKNKKPRQISNTNTQSESKDY